MRVVTFNVRGFRHGRERVADVVRGLEPDVLLLQETGRRRTLRRFAASVGMVVATDPRSPLRRRVKNAVLVRDGTPFVSSRLTRFPGSRRWYPRGALAARIGGPFDVWALSVHLGLEGRERGRQAEALLETVGSLGAGPVVVGGDLNATPDMRAPSRVAATLHDAWTATGAGSGATFPATAPSARIDYVFVNEGIDVRSIAVDARDPTASDHLPVVAELILPAG